MHTQSESERGRPRIGLVHDHLAQRGGAERVALSIASQFAGTPLITSVFVPEQTYPGFSGVDVRPTYPNRIPWIRRDPRRALPFMRSAFTGVDVGAVDVTLCSSSGWSHLVRTSAPKVVYCHNPPRWLYQTESYVGHVTGVRGRALKSYLSSLRATDAEAAHDAALYLTNSTTVQARVREAYGIESSVLPPPVTLSTAGVRHRVPGLEPGFFLTVGRGRAYKNTDAVIEVFSDRPDDVLVVVGSRSAAGDRQRPANIVELGGVTDEQLRWLYENCSALVTLSEEDFGLTPLEANSFGRPAIAIDAGGFRDTIVDGVNGLLVADQGKLDGAVTQMLARVWEPDLIRAHASMYNEPRFHMRLGEALMAASERRSLIWSHDPSTVKPDLKRTTE